MQTYLSFTYGKQLGPLASISYRKNLMLLGWTSRGTVFFSESETWTSGVRSFALHHPFEITFYFLFLTSMENTSSTFQKRNNDFFVCLVIEMLEQYKKAIFIAQFNHSVVSDSATSRMAAGQASLSITNSRSLLRLTSIELVMLSNHLILPPPSSLALNLSQHQCLFQ